MESSEDAIPGSLVGRQRYGETVGVSGIQAGTTRTIVYYLRNDLHWSRVEVEVSRITP